MTRADELAQRFAARGASPAQAPPLSNAEATDEFDVEPAKPETHADHGTPSVLPETTPIPRVNDRATPRRRKVQKYEDLHKRATWILPQWLPTLVKRAADKNGESQAAFVTRVLRDAIQSSGFSVPDVSD